MNLKKALIAGISLCLSSQLFASNPGVDTVAREMASRNASSIGNLHEELAAVALEVSDFKNYDIGTQKLGGFVGCTKKNGGLNLIVRAANDSSGIAWSNIINKAVGFAAQSLSNGANDTLAIISQQGFTAGAASICSQLSSGGYTDWHLPSFDELHCLYENRVALNDLSGFTALGGFYWTSTESANISPATTAIAEDFAAGGGQQLAAKALELAVRCVRQL